MKLSEKLKKIGACDYAVEWVKDGHEVDAWQSCGNSSWMFWLLKKTATKKDCRKFVLIACDCAMLVKDRWLENDDGSANAIRLAYAWAHGEKVSLGELNAASEATNAAAWAAERATAWDARTDPRAATWNATNAASEAANAAISGAKAAISAAKGENPDAHATWAACAASASAWAMINLNDSNDKKCCDIIRNYFKTLPKF